MTAGVLTLDVLKRAAALIDVRREHAPQLFLMSKYVLGIAQRAGQQEARRILSEMCAATRPVFGDILVWDDPDAGKAGRWFLGAGSWPYTAPDPLPPDPRETWAAIERATDTAPFWRSTL